MCWIYREVRENKEAVIGRVVINTFRTQYVKARKDFGNSNLHSFLSHSLPSFFSLRSLKVSGTLPTLWHLIFKIILQSGYIFFFTDAGTEAQSGLTCVRSPSY